MPLPSSAASAATLPHVPPRGAVTAQLAARALKLAAVFAENEACQAALDEMRTLQGNACFHPSGSDVGAAFQLSIVLGILESAEEGGLSEGELRAMDYLLRQVLRHIGSGEPFAGYFYAA